MNQLFQNYWNDIGEAATLSGGEVSLPEEERARSGCSTTVKVLRAKLLLLHLFLLLLRVLQLILVATHFQLLRLPSARVMALLEKRLRPFLLAEV